MLEVSNIEVCYGDYQVIWGVSLEVGEGEVVSLLGPNGSGKSTVFNTISGLLKPKSGMIEFTGTRIDNQATHDIVRLGLAHILERRRVFPYLTVRQNLWLGATTWSVAVDDQVAAEANLLRLLLADERMVVTDFRRREYDLEDVFVKIVEGQDHDSG